MRGTRWRSWLRHCAKSRKVAGSIPDGVIGIFHWHKPSGRSMALGSTQPLTEMSTRNISWRIKAASAYGWQPNHLHVPNVLKSRSLNLLEPSEPVQTCNGIVLSTYEEDSKHKDNYFLFFLPQKTPPNNNNNNKWSHLFWSNSLAHPHIY